MSPGHLGCVFLEFAHGRLRVLCMSANVPPFLRVLPDRSLCDLSRVPVCASLTGREDLILLGVILYLQLGGSKVALLWVSICSVL